MAPSTIRKALGAVKDQTSIGIAKVASNTAPDLDVAIVKATSHDDDPADEKYIREIINLTSYSKGYVNACVSGISKRLGKTRDWIVALKSLMLVHRLLLDGDPSFQQELMYATRRGTRLLNMSDFRDEAHSNSWDHSAFVRTYALYLDQRLEFIVYERKHQGLDQNQRNYRGTRSDEFDSNRGEGGDYSNNRSPPPSYGDESRDDGRRSVTPVREMKPERLLGRMHHLQQILDRFLACRPTGSAKNSRMILIALFPLVKESFQLYADICELLAILLDRFFDLDYPDCVKAFEAYASAAKQIDELAVLYSWCKETGVARSSEYPLVQKITDKLLETLEEFMRDRGRKPKTPLPVPEKEEPVQDTNTIKALPAPEGYEERQRQPEMAPSPAPAPALKPTEDLVNLRDDGITADNQGNNLALALFAESNESWEAFPSEHQEPTSAWQLADTGKADWELALVESASNLSKQKATLAGGFDPLLLNGMYDQGSVQQQVGMQKTSGGSSSSVALPGTNKTPMLALPAPDGTTQTVVQDPFHASLSVPPPSYVQMSEIEKKQQLLVQEQMLWQQYARDGMQGQVALSKLSNPAAPAMAYGYGVPPGGYYYTPY